MKNKLIKLCIASISMILVCISFNTAAFSYENITPVNNAGNVLNYTATEAKQQNTTGLINLGFGYNNFSDSIYPKPLSLNKSHIVIFGMILILIGTLRRKIGS